MVKAYQKLKVHRYPNIKMPNATSLIAIGHRAYLATSITGGANYIEMNGNYKVQAALAQCGADYELRGAGLCPTIFRSQSKPVVSWSQGMISSKDQDNCMMLTFCPSLLDHNLGIACTNQYFNHLGTMR